MRNRIGAISLAAVVLVLFSIPAAAQWAAAGSLKGGMITSFAVIGTKIFACTRQGGVFLSADDGASWKSVDSGLPDRADFQCLAALGTDLFAGTVEKGVYLSKDNGASWSAANSGLPKNSPVWRLAVAGTTLFAAAGSDTQATVFRSDDGGMSWTAANNGLAGMNVLCLAAVGPDLFAGGGIPPSNPPAGVFLSTNNGTSWTPTKSTILAKTVIMRFAVIGDILYAGSYTGGRVYLTKSKGEWWSNVSAGLPHFETFSLSDLTVSGTNLLVGSFRGVWSSDNEGVTWRALNAGLPDPPLIYSLCVSGTNLFAGTEEGKVWRLPLSEDSLKKAQSSDPSNPEAAELEDMVVLLKQTLGQMPTYTDGWKKLGATYAKLGRNVEAIAAYKTAVKFEPKAAEVWYALGECYEKAGLKDDAAAAFAKAKKLKPELFKK
jgi:Tetratricopeptide repeat